MRDQFSTEVRARQYLEAEGYKNHFNSHGEEYWENREKPEGIQIVHIQQLVGGVYALIRGRG